MTLSSEILAWRAEILRPPGPPEERRPHRAAAINRLIPEKVHVAITTAISGTTWALLVRPR